MVSLEVDGDSGGPARHVTKQAKAIDRTTVDCSPEREPLGTTSRRPGALIKRDF